MRWLTIQQLKSKNPATRCKAFEKLADENDPGLFDLALAATSDPSATVRKVAVECMGKVRVEQSLAPFLRALQDRDEQVRLAAIGVLTRFRGQETMDALAQMLHDAAGVVRARAAIALESLGWQPKTDEMRVAVLVSRGKVEETGAYGATAVPALVEVLKNGAYHTRQQAVQVLSRIGGPNVVKPLIGALHDPENLVRNSAIEALADTGDARAVEPLLQLLREKDDKVRAAVVRALSKIGDSRAVEPLISVLRDNNWDVRLAAIEALARFKDPRTVKPLLSCLKDKDRDVRQATVETLGKIGDVSAIEALVEAVTDESNIIRDAVAVALKRINPHWERTPEAKAAVPALEQAQKSNEYWVRTSAGEVLAKIRPQGETQTFTDLTTFANPAHLKRQAATTALVAALQHEDRDIRQAAAEALGQLGNPDALQTLVQALDDKDEWVRRAAAESMDSQNWLPANKAQRFQQLTILGRWETLAEVGLEALAPLIELLKQGSPSERAGAILALSRIPDERATTALADCFNHGDAGVRGAAAQALVDRQWNPPDPAARARLAIELGKWDDLPALGAAAVAPLLATIRRRMEDGPKARQAAGTLGRLQGTGTVGAMLTALADPAVAQEIVTTLEQLFINQPQIMSVEDLQTITRLERVPHHTHQFDEVSQTYVHTGSSDLDCAMLRQMAEEELAQRGQSVPPADQNPPLTSPAQDRE